MKKITILSIKTITIFIISLFILIPNVKAKEKTKTYYNYYFFLENYKSDENIKKTTENETAFFRLKLGYELNSLNSEEVKLTKNKTTTKKCEQIYKDANLTEWPYLCFYDMWHKLRTSGNTIDYKADGTKCQTKNLSVSNNYFYYHGCHRSVGATEWSGGGQVEPEGGEYSLNNSDFATKTYSKSCASFNRENNVNIVPIENSDYVYAKITRSPANPDINWEKKFDVAFNISKCPDETITDDGQTYSPVLYRVKYEVSEYSCDEDKIPSNLTCNSSNSIESNCQKLTIKSEKENVIADIKINQKGYISNILTPTEIYQGGGIKLGFIYYNTLSWEYSGRKPDTEEEKNIIKGAVQDKIKKDFKDQIKTEVSFTSNIKTETIDSSLIQITCNESGSFEEGKTLTTICTIFLPNSNVELGTGKVEYNNSKYPNYGINNQYYTPLSYTGDYKVSATLSGLNVLNSNEDDGIEDWTMTFDDDDSCTVNVYNRLYEKDSTNYKFIYRPINLNNPFPDRNAGVNWYEWYSKDSNKKRLQESYSKLQYQVTLDNQTVAKIKDYNTNYNYLEWDNIENGESKFIDEYFNTKRQNIVGDDS